MARPRSKHVDEVKQKLIARLQNNFLRPGDRFLSSRAVASRFKVSYQTAHRLLVELQSEGRLLRNRASGTFVPGEPARPTVIGLHFHSRARRPGSFGHRLLEELSSLLRREQLPFTTTLGESPRAAAGEFPVVWEVNPLTAWLAASQRPGLLLNDRPPPGMSSLHLDSVSTDDYSGGVCAAQLLGPALRKRGKAVILTGPPDDSRSNQRIAGFISLRPATRVAGRSWYLEDALERAPRVLALRPAGIFCCNDRLAQGVIEHARSVGAALPPLVGFDDAPIAEALNLTTIAIPWRQLLGAAVSIIKRRLGGDTAAPIHQIVPPGPVVRGSCPRP